MKKEDKEKERKIKKKSNKEKFRALLYDTLCPVFVSIKLMD
jgi:hypothetical protein